MGKEKKSHGKNCCEWKRRKQLRRGSTNGTAQEQPVGCCNLRRHFWQRSSSMTLALRNSLGFFLWSQNLPTKGEEPFLTIYELRSDACRASPTVVRLDPSWPFLDLENERVEQFSKIHFRSLFFPALIDLETFYWLYYRTCYYCQIEHQKISNIF